MATQLNLNQIKENVQTFLQDANTATADAYLSESMVTPVQSILKTNPERIRPDATDFPFITVFITGKNIEKQDMSRNDAIGKRWGTVQLRLVAGVWNDSYKNRDEDPADNEIEYLMENIELVLRNQDNFLAGNTTIQTPGNVEYFTHMMEEENHLRVGVMDYEVKLLY